jgi:predicted negative regulator of RcsB-dependent stress response
MDKRNLTTLAVIVVLIVLGFFGYQSWAGRSGQEGLDESAIQELNPFAAEAPANPFEKGGNPYENVKTNPFE